MNRVSEWIAPKAFELFQLSLGGTIAKRKLVLRYYSGGKHILEVGCSVGNIATAFLGRKVEYVGIDIDEAAIAYAARKFRRYPNFSFICGDLRRRQFEHDFDFIIFSGILHHLSDGAASTLLEFSTGLLAPGGSVLVSDPIQPTRTDSRVIKLYRKLERGQYVRSMTQLSNLLTDVHDLHIVQQRCLPVTALPFGSKPTVSHFGLFLLDRTECKRSAGEQSFTRAAQGSPSAHGRREKEN